MRRTLWLMLILTAAAAIGCGPRLELPAGFVEVDQAYDEYDQRAVSAEGVVLAVRSADNPKQGTEAFWAKAVERELTARRGYALTQREDVADASGRSGVLMMFDVTREATDLKYMTAVFVWGRKVVIAEGGGPAEAVSSIEDDLRKALLSVR